MGQLLSSLSLRGSDMVVPELTFDLESMSPRIHAYVDHKKTNALSVIGAKPSSEESELCNELSSLLVQPGPRLLDSLKNYTSASTLVRTAIASPTEENEDNAWKAVLPIVDMLKEFYGYASDLRKFSPYYTSNGLSVILTLSTLKGEGVPRILNVLCQGDVAKNLEKYQGLTKLFADILDFVFEFDHLKV